LGPVLLQGARTVSAPYVEVDTAGCRGQRPLRGHQSSVTLDWILRQIHNLYEKLLPFTVLQDGAQAGSNVPSTRVGRAFGRF
jgi:hypothetical protein